MGLLYSNKPMSLVQWGHTKLEIDNRQSNKSPTDYSGTADCQSIS